MPKATEKRTDKKRSEMPRRTMGAALGMIENAAGRLSRFAGREKKRFADGARGGKAAAPRTKSAGRRAKAS